MLRGCLCYCHSHQYLLFATAANAAAATRLPPGTRNHTPVPNAPADSNGAHTGRYERRSRAVPGPAPALDPALLHHEPHYLWCSSPASAPVLACSPPCWMPRRGLGGDGLLAPLSEFLARTVDVVVFDDDGDELPSSLDAPASSLTASRPPPPPPARKGGWVPPNRRAIGPTLGEWLGGGDDGGGDVPGEDRLR